MIENLGKLNMGKTMDKMMARKVKLGMVCGLKNMEY
jgi:hypothetical protein